MDMEKLVKEWLEAVEKEQNHSNYNHWAIDYVMDLYLDEKYEELWGFIKCAYSEKLSKKIAAILAAGPLEDLLAGSGEKYINEIAILARKDPGFRSLLGGVWQNSMSDSLWTKVKVIRGEI